MLAIDRHVSLTGVAPGGCSYVDGEDDNGMLTTNDGSDGTVSRPEVMSR